MAFIHSQMNNQTLSLLKKKYKTVVCLFVFPHYYFSEESSIQRNSPYILVVQSHQPFGLARWLLGKEPIKTFPGVRMTPASLPAGLVTLVTPCQWLRSALSLQASLPSQNRQMVMWGQVVQTNFSDNDKHSQWKIRNISFLKWKAIWENSSYFLKTTKQ